ncbi:MAG: hypothetical protein ACRCTQ_05930 [Brevinemataceae bacterium]
MENFRPPVMEEVTKKKGKAKKLIIITIFVVITAVSIGGVVGFRKLQEYLGYLSIEKRYQLLKDFFGALSVDDTANLNLFAPNVSQLEEYALQVAGGKYSIFIYPKLNDSDNTLLFQIINFSVEPNKSYINQVTFGSTESDKMVIENLVLLNKGYQIH